MTKILIIDDDPIFQKMLSHALEPVGYQVLNAGDGLSGLTAAGAHEPDLVICDVMMPNLDGYETVRRLRKNPRFAQTPILMLTAQSELEEKLIGFEAGVDDYMTKPFAPPELLARVSNLLRKSELIKQVPREDHPKKGRLIAFHSLRGGTGCSTLAVNTAVGLAGIWGKPVCILDMVLTAGQVALMLNGSLKRTWADLGSINPEDLDLPTLLNIQGKHESGLSYFAAPTFPPQAELLTADLFDRVIDHLQGQFDYLIADLPHDFHEITYHVLDRADKIVLIAAPEMASLRATAAALETYRRLGYPEDKVHLVLNWIFERRGIARKNIETALHQTIDMVFPFSPEVSTEALNYGQPFLYHKPTENLSILLENFAFALSREEERGIPPAIPSKAWLRVTQRLRAAAS